MEFDIKDIYELLNRIVDPETNKGLIEAGIVTKAELLDRELTIFVNSARVGADQRTEFYSTIATVLQSEYPELNVNMHMENSSSNDKETKSSPLPAVQNIIAVASGKGGVGKSTIAVNLAFALKNRGFKVGILDADIYGPSIPTMLGIQNQKPTLNTTLTTPKMLPIEVKGVKSISIGMIVEPDQAVVLRGPRLAGILKQFIQDTIWGTLDFLIVDLPPGTGDIQLSLVQSVPLSGVVIVTTPQDVAIADALRAMNMFKMEQINVPVLGIVENMAWFSPDELPDHKYFIFGQGGGDKLADLGETQILGRVPLRMGIREAGDSGTPWAETNHISDFDEIVDNTLTSMNAILNTKGKSNIVEVNKSI